MKKYVTVALAAILVVAFAAVAIGQATQRQHTMDVSVTPSDSGTKKKPKGVKAKIRITTDPNENPTVDKFTYQLPKEIKLSTKGFKFCSVENIEDNGVAKCPRKSKVGSGIAQAYGNARNSGVVVPLDVTLFAGSKDSLTVFVKGQEGSGFEDLESPIPVAINDGTGEFGQNLVADIPPNIEKYAGSVDVVLDYVDLTIGRTLKKVVRRNGRKVTLKFHLLSSRACPSSKLWNLGTILEYTRPVGAAPTRAEQSTPCTK